MNKSKELYICSLRDVFSTNFESSFFNVRDMKHFYKGRLSSILFSVLLLMLFLFVQQANSQVRKYWYVEPSAGFTINNAVDIHSGGIFPGPGEWRFGGGMELGWQLGYVIGISGNISYAKLSGVNDVWHESFEADFIETALNGRINLMNIFAGNKRSDRKFNFYFIGGLGISQVNTIHVKNTDTDPDTTKWGYGHGHGLGGRTFASVFKYGMKGEYYINPRLSVGLSVINSYADNDIIDGHGPESGYKGSTSKDIYGLITASIQYRIGSGVREAQDSYKSSRPTRTRSAKPARVKKTKVSKKNRVSSSGGGGGRGFISIGKGSRKGSEKVPRSMKRGRSSKAVKIKTGRYNGYPWRRGQDWIRIKKHKEDKYSKYRGG